MIQLPMKTVKQTNVGIAERGGRRDRIRANRRWIPGVVRVWAPVLAMAGAGYGVGAGTYYVNSSDVSVLTAPTGAQVGAEFRMSPGAFDLSMNPGGGTGVFPDPNPDFLATHLGNLSAIAGVTFDFALEHRLGQGFVFSVTREGTGVTKVLAWGDGFSPAVPGNATRSPSLRGETPGFSDDGAETSFNALFLEARAALSGSSLSFSDLGFWSPTLLAGTGTFQSGTVTPTTEDPWNDLTGTFSEAGYWRQMLVTDDDLADHNWTLTGSLNGTRAGLGHDDAVHFVIEGVNVSAVFPSVGDPGLRNQPVPEASTWLSGAVVMLGLAGCWVRRVRR